MTSLLIETATRLCKLPTCINPLIKRRGETNPEFLAREYCSRSCSGTARGNQNRTQPKPASAQTLAPPPFKPRIENGVWRPNAPGWPAAPHIPQRHAQRTTA